MKIADAVKKMIEGRSCVTVDGLISELAPGLRVTPSDRHRVGQALRKAGWVPKVRRKNPIAASEPAALRRYWLHPRYAEAESPLERYLADHPPVNE